VHFEFSSYLGELLRRSGVFERYELDADPFLSAFRYPAKQLEICSCPPYVSGWISSPVCFELAQAARAKTRSQVSAPDIVDMLICSASEDPWFELTLGGEGHLNALPRERFIDCYLEKVTSSSGVPLRRFESFVCGTLRVEGAELENILPRLAWNEICDRAAKMKDNADARSLAAHSLALSQPDWRQALMLLSIMADPEIALEPYMQGLAGRQNTPWYLRRFFTDWKHLSEEMASGNRQSSTSSGGAFPRSGLLRAFEQGLRRLLGLRSVYLRSFLTSQPELLLGEILELTKAFYSLYNDPSGRAALLQENGEMFPRKIQGLSSAIALAVFDGLRCMEAKFQEESQFKQSEEFLREL
jgi:hypothetical protein